MGAQEGTPGFVARLSDATNGAPLSFPTASSAPEGVEPIQPKSPGRKVKDSKLVPRPGAMNRFLIEDDARAHLRRALLVIDARAMPRKSRPGHEEAALALESNPDDLLAALLHLETFARPRCPGGPRTT